MTKCREGLSHSRAALLSGIPWHNMIHSPFSADKIRPKKKCKALQFHHFVSGPTVKNGYGHLGSRKTINLTVIHWLQRKPNYGCFTTLNRRDFIFSDTNGNAIYLLHHPKKKKNTPNIFIMLFNGDFEFRSML